MVLSPSSAVSPEKFPSGSDARLESFGASAVSPGPALPLDTISPRRNNLSPLPPLRIRPSRVNQSSPSPSPVGTLPARPTSASSSPSSLRKTPLGPVLERRDSRLFDRQQSRAVEEERTRCAQLPGRDAVTSINSNGGGDGSSGSGNGGSQQLAWSDIKRLHPWRWQMARLGYRLEVFLESATHRVYALIALAAFVLLASMTAFLLVAWVSGEYSELAADARVGGDAAKYEWAGRSGIRSSSARTNEGVFWFGRGDITDDIYEEDDDEGEDHANTLIYSAWLIWTCFVDTAAHVQKFDRARLPFTLAVACCVSLLGILFFSVVLGFSVDLLAAAAKGITEGDFEVPEKGHFLVLGYSTKAVAMVTELAMVMASSQPPTLSMFSFKTKGCIVVLADYPSKQEFDYQVNTQLHSLGLQDSVRVVFRRGSPLYAANLAKVAPEASRAIVVLSDTREDPDRADALILNVVLGLKAILEDGRAAPDRDRIEEKSEPRKQHFFSPSKDRGKVPRGLNRNAHSSRSFSTGLEGFRDFLTSPHDQVPTLQSNNSSSDSVASGGSGIGSISEVDVTSNANTSPSTRRRWSLPKSMSSSQIDEHATASTATTAGMLTSDTLTPDVVATPPPFQRRLTRRLSLAVPHEDEDAPDPSLANKSGHTSPKGISNDSKNGPGNSTSSQLKWYQGHIVAELADIDSRPLIQVCGGKPLELIIVHDLIGQLLAKSAAHPSASRVLNPILGFDGCECYFKSHPTLVGCSLREASLRLSGAILIGIRKSSSTLTTPKAMAAGVPAKRGLRRKGSKVLLHPEGRAHALKAFHAKKTNPTASSAAAAAEKNEAEHALGSKQSSKRSSVRSSRSFDGTPLGASLSNASVHFNVEASSDAFALAARGLVELPKSDDSDAAEEECIIEAGDELVLIAEDANSYQVLSRPFFDTESSFHCRPWPPPPPQDGLVTLSSSDAAPLTGDADCTDAGKEGPENASTDQTSSTNNAYRGLTAFETLEYEVVAAGAARDDAVADANAALFPTAPVAAPAPVAPVSAPASPTAAPLQLVGIINNNDIAINNVDGNMSETKSSVDGSADGLASASNGIIGETNLSFTPTLTTGVFPQVCTAPEPVLSSLMESSALEAKPTPTAADSTEAAQMGTSSSIISETTKNVHANTAAAKAAARVAQAAAPSVAWRLNGMHVVVCGWRRDVKDLIRELDQSLPPRSSVTILCDRNAKEVSAYLKDYCSKPANGLLVQHVYARPDVRHQLEKSGALQFAQDSALRKVDVILVVAEEDQERDLLLSDSQVLATVLLIRDLHVQHLVSNGQVSQPPTLQQTLKGLGQFPAAADQGEKSMSEKINAQAEGESSLSSLSRTQLEKLQVDLPIVAEVLDVATKATIAESPALDALADYVVVHDIAAKLLAATAERREVASVLTEFMGSVPGTVGLRSIEASALLYPNELVADPTYATVPLDGESPSFPVSAVLDQQQQQQSSMEHARPSAASSPRLPFLDRGNNSEDDDSSSNNGSSSSSRDEPMPSSVPCRPVSFAELSLRCLAAPVRGVLVGYIKATQLRTGSSYSTSTSNTAYSSGSGSSNTATNNNSNSRNSNSAAQPPSFAAGAPIAQPVGPKVTVVNPAGKGAPLYWHQGDFLVLLAAGDAASHAEARSPLAIRRFPVVR